MNTNKKTILVFILIAITALAIYGLNYVMTATKINVKSLDAVIDIDESGDMLVTERWGVRFPNGGSVTFRDIGYGKYDPNNPLYQDTQNTASFDEDSVAVKVYDKDKQELSAGAYRVGYSFRNDRDERGNRIIPPKTNMETIFIHVYDGMQSEMTFEYKYKINGAVTLYQDIAELNWKLFEYFPSKISRSTVIVTTPTGVVNAWGHGLSRGVVHLEDKSVRFEMKNIKKDELLEFRILMDPDDFSVADKNYLAVNMRQRIADYETKLAVETNRRITAAQVIFYGTFAMNIIMVLFMIIAYVKYDKEHAPQFVGKYYRELPADYTPAEMSYLYYFRKINDEDVTATLLDLIRRKYLMLDTTGERVSAKNQTLRLRSIPSKKLWKNCFRTKGMLSIGL